jgi:hypothetical protein
MLAHDLIVWTQAVLLNGELAKAATGALPASPRRRPGRVIRTPRHAAPSHSLALYPGAQGRVQQAQHAPRHYRLNPGRRSTRP